jgi:uncharacterized protein YjiS (DUF1127 family)
MAYITAPTTNAIARPSRLMRGLAAIGAFFISYAEMRSRREMVEALLRLTDEELAARGLTREDAVAHVFSDRFYL